MVYIVLLCFGVHVELLQITILKLGQDMKDIMRNQVLQFHCFDFCLPTLPRWFSEEELDEVVDWSLYWCRHLRVCLCPSGRLFHVRNWRGQQYHLKSHLLLLGFARRDADGERNLGDSEDLDGGKRWAGPMLVTTLKFT